MAMARNNVNVCLTLPGPLLKKLDEKSQRDERPRSFVVRKILEHSLAGELERFRNADLKQSEITPP
jgi:metal-responsive CopG/Arc/MetJ family transcriptional regulator